MTRETRPQVPGPRPVRKGAGEGAWARPDRFVLQLHCVRVGGEAALSIQHVPGAVMDGTASPPSLQMRKRAEGGSGLNLPGPGPQPRLLPMGLPLGEAVITG